VPPLPLSTVSDAYVLNSGAHVQATVWWVAGWRTLATSSADWDWDWRCTVEEQQRQ